MLRSAYLMLLLLTLFCGCHETTVDFQDPDVYSLILDNIKYTGGNYDAAYSASANSFVFNFYLKNSARRVHLDVSSPAVLKPFTTYPLGTDTVKNTRYAALYHTGLESYSGFSGTLTITNIDTVNRYISGTFSFNARNSGGTIARVASGTFDNALYIKH